MQTRRNFTDATATMNLGWQLVTAWSVDHCWPGNRISLHTDKAKAERARDAYNSAVEDEERHAFLTEKKNAFVVDSDEMLPVYRIPESNMDKLERKMKSLVKRADKLGLEAPSHQIVGMLDVPVVYTDYLRQGEISHYDRFSLVAIKARPVGLQGWDFVATIQHIAAEEGGYTNIIRMSPHHEGTALDGRYRTIAPLCEHCGTTRRRNDTYICRHTEDGTIMQIGRNCLADFIGVRDGTNVAQLATYERDLYGSLEEMEGGGFGGSSRYFSLVKYLVWTARSIAVDGWLSRGAARKSYTDKTATADLALGLMHGRGKHAARDRQRVENELGEEGMAKAIEDAEAALSWCREIDEDTKSDYLWNLRAATAGVCITSREAGIVASAISAHKRALDRELQRRKFDALPNVNEHFGAEGDKIGRKLSSKDKKNGKASHPAVTGTVLFVREMMSDYGYSELVKIRGDSGHTFTWFSSRANEVERGDRVRLIGTIKRHKTYKDNHETQLTRCVLEAIEA